MEIEYKAEVDRLREEHNQLTEVYYALRGDRVVKLVRSGLLRVLQLIFALFTFIGVVAFFLFQFLEPFVITLLTKEVDQLIVEDIASISRGMFVFKVVTVCLTILTATISFLLRKIRDKNLRIKEAVHVIKSLMDTTRANLERAEERLKGLLEYASTYQRKETERGDGAV